MSTAQVTAQVTAPHQVATSAEAAYHAPRKGISWKAVGRHAFLVLMCLWVLLPLAWVLLLSFKTLQDGAHNWIWPKNGFVAPNLNNYDFVLNNPRKVGTIWTLFKSSVLV